MVAYVVSHAGEERKVTTTLCWTLTHHTHLIPRLHSDLRCRQRCLQWYNGSLITRYQWSVTDASLHASPAACMLNNCLQWFKVGLRTLITANSCWTHTHSTTATIGGERVAEQNWDGEKKYFMERKKKLLTAKMNLELKNRILKCLVFSVAPYAVEI